MSAHTPGPWVCDVTDQGGTGRGAIFRDPGKARLVALANSLGGESEETIIWALSTIEQLREQYQFQVEANRSLVEACGKAMDINDVLLRALEDCIDYIADIAKASECHTARRLHATARAAIAKATGEA